MLTVKCASSDSYVPPPMGAVGDTFEDLGVSDDKKTQLFPQKVISMQYRPKIQEYRPLCGKNGHNGGGGAKGDVFFGRNFSRLSFLNVSLSVRVQIRINAYSKL